MKKSWTTLLVAISLIMGVALLIALGSPSVGASGSSSFKADLDGFQEVPPVSTTAEGEFEAKISGDETSISYELSYSDLEAPAVASHIHFGRPGVNGGVIAFLCGGGGKPACPTTSGTVTGTITAADVIGPTAQGIAPGEFAEAIRAMREESTYVNVHSTTFPGGEIRGHVK